MKALRRRRKSEARREGVAEGHDAAQCKQAEVTSVAAIEECSEMEAVGTDVAFTTTERVENSIELLRHYLTDITPVSNRTTLIHIQTCTDMYRLEHQQPYKRSESLA